MIKQLFSYLLIAFAFTSVFTSCNDDDDTPREKTPEEIAAENFAEFKELVGTGIGSDDYQEVYLMEEFSDIPTPTEMEKFEFSAGNKDQNQGFVINDEGYVLYVGTFNVKITGKSYDLEKREDGVFVFSVDVDDEIEFYDQRGLNENTRAKIRLHYDTNTNMVTNLMNGYIGGVFFGGAISKYKAEPHTFTNDYTGENVMLMRAKGLKTYRSTTENFTGIKNVHVALKTTAWYAVGILNLLKPKGEHHVKFTPTNDGTIQIQFCNAQGEVSGEEDLIHYDYNTTNHFWKNRMPMALNLLDVDFIYNKKTGVISQGTGVVAQARENGNPKGVFPALLLGDKKDQDSGSNATIIETYDNSPENFIIKIALDFELPFYCEITK